MRYFDTLAMVDPLGNVIGKVWNDGPIPITTLDCDSAGDEIGIIDGFGAGVSGCRYTWFITVYSGPVGNQVAQAFVTFVYP